WSESHLPFANMPERRMPCLAIQKICASEYCVPAAGRSGIGGYKVSLDSFGFPGVPWHPAHSLRYSLPPAIRFSSVGAMGFGTSGALRRTDAWTAEYMNDLSHCEGGRSARTSASPSFRYRKPPMARTSSVVTTPRRKCFNLQHPF